MEYVEEHPEMQWDLVRISHKSERYNGIFEDRGTFGDAVELV